MTSAERLTPPQERDTLSIAVDGRGLGGQVRKLRTRQGITQAALAERIGMSAVFIRKLESGERLASIDTLERLAKALGATVRIDLIARRGGGRHGR